MYFGEIGSMSSFYQVTNKLLPFTLQETVWWLRKSMYVALIINWNVAVYFEL